MVNISLTRRCREGGDGHGQEEQEGQEEEQEVEEEVAVPCPDDSGPVMHRCRPRTAPERRASKPV
jgi:hypothetical protein